MNVSDLIRQLNKIKKHTPDVEVCFVTESDKVEPVSKLGIGFYKDEFPSESTSLLTIKEIPDEEGLTKVIVLG